MLSKNKIKFFNSLSLKKNRDELGLFIAEGEKLIQELIQSNFSFYTIAATESIINNYISIDCEIITATNDELKRISSRESPPNIIAICKKPVNKLKQENLSNDLTIVLDGIQDPGNLGTIIRMSSWFGINQIVCSPDTADCFNPKVIQSTMGAIAHVPVFYSDLNIFLTNAHKAGINIYGTFIEGENIYTSDLNSSGIVVFGNEGKGISKEVEKCVTHKLAIPTFSNKQSVESLNVSMAASIVLSEFRRRN